MFTETLNTMVDKINILINIFGSEETRVMFDATELLKEGMHFYIKYIISIF